MLTEAEATQAHSDNQGDKTMKKPFNPEKTGFTTRAIIDKLSRDINEVMRLPDVEERMAKLGTRFFGGTPDEFRKFVAGEIDKWAEAVRAAGITPE